MDFEECHKEESLRSLSDLIHQLMVNEACAVERLTELTGLSNVTLERILSGAVSDMNIGIFSSILQALQFKLIIEKNGVSYNISEYIVPENLEVKACPKCYQWGIAVTAERANSEIQKEIEEKDTFFGVRKTIRELETRSYYSNLFLPPDNRWGEKVLKIKKKLFEAMMVCKNCNLLFDNERKKTANCDALGYERMLSTALIPK